jgi:diguanylate cyclase (GGDEF)-like protein
MAALLWAVAAIAGTPAAASRGVIGEPLAVCIRRAEPGVDARTLLRAPAGFDCRTRQRAFGPGDYWALSQPVELGRDRPARIRIASLWQRSATLHALYADGAVATLAGDGRATSRRLQLGALPEYKLPVRGVPVVRLLWHVEGAANMRGILVAPHSVSAAESAQSNLMLAGLYAGFAGMCLSLLIYNIALWGALRHRFQLSYCVMVATLLVYAASSSGALAWFWPEITNNDRLRINYLALALSAASALGFARTFFERRVFAGRIGLATNVVTAMLIGSALSFIVLAPWQAKLLDQIYAISFGALVMIACPVLWRAWRLRSNYLWLFAVAWAVPIGFATLRIVGNFGGIGWSFWLDNSTLIAMASEAVMSSLAIAYRIKLLSRERDHAREQEIAARLLADTDPLTGLLNRRAFLRQAIGRGGDQTLLVIDIDHFKHVNETIGHDGGDEVLRLVSRALRRVVGADALVARIGGEEFAVVNRAGVGVDAGRVLEALRVERMPFDVAVTASIGACTGPLARETDWKALYRRADQALFAAKAAGRDRARDADAIAFAA